MALDRGDFLGAWTLQDWRIEYADGRVTRPFGAQPQGLLLYTENTMSATICSARRGLFGKANARRASAEQKASAFDSYFHYAGRWRIEGNKVVHEIHTALNPDMVGQDQVRVARFGPEQTLKLSADEVAEGGGRRRHILSWTRCLQPTIQSRADEYKS